MGHDIAWYCMVLHCIAWYCKVLHDIAWYWSLFCKKQRHQGSEIFLRRLNLVELLEANHGCDFSECSSRDVEAVLSDETRSAASDSALSETSAFGVFALVREPDVFVSMSEKSVRQSKSDSKMG